MSSKLSEAQDEFFEAFASMSAEDREAFAYYANKSAPLGHAFMMRAQAVYDVSKALSNLSKAIEGDEMMTNKTWTITLQGKVATFEQDYDVPNGKVAERGTTMARPLDVFLAGLDKMKAAGAVVVEGRRDDE